jgi:putative hydrolase of the HAD superfamily
MQFQAIIFDLYGTLVDDFASSVGQLHTDFVRTLGVPDEPFISLWSQTTDMRVRGAFQSVEASIEYVCNLLGTSVTTEQMSRAVEIRLQLVRRTLVPRRDALETVTHLKNEGFKIGLLSNCSIEIPILWPETPLSAVIDSAVFSSRECLTKPDPRIYQLACQRLDVAAEFCLYVADGENFELAAAAGARLTPVLLRNAACESRSELLREANEWQGAAIGTLSEVSGLITSCKKTVP